MGLRLLFHLCVALSLCTRTPATTAAAAAPASTLGGGGSERDGIALLGFKSNIKQDPHGVFSSWNESLHFCNWQGVICSRSHRRVTILDLGDKALVGSLSPYIGNLSFLQEMRLRNNTLQGEIPPEFGRLFRLQILNLNYNSLQGEVPANLSHCSNLVFLGLRNNKLVGKIPVELLASLSKLIGFSIGYNNLTGSIPPSIGNMTSLESLYASFNGLEGSIPDELGRLKSLKLLGLAANEHSGMIPPSIYNLSFITAFSLPYNQLYGTLPPNLGLTLPRLEILELQQNHFTGSIPTSLSNASRFQRLQLMENNFTGPVSVDFRGLQNFSFINLDDNYLGNGESDDLSFLNSLANCTNLEVLVLQRNHFQGPLPNSIANFSIQLRLVAFGANQISGGFPSWIATLTNLEVLGMQDNRFTGRIPEEIGNLQKLQRMSLSTNKLSGEIPSSLGNLSLLNGLFLDNNRLQGAIPSSLGNCQSLNVLNLSQNSLTGIIPIQIFNILDLSISLNLAQNHLVGPLPGEIGNLAKLSELDVSENKLFGEIPGSLGHCISLEYLLMAGNFFQGSIPPTLDSLKGLRKFDLSRNNLSGRIPSFFEDFSLENLNLSFNNFEGEVEMKGVFINASVISVVGNKKLCGGVPKLQLPRCRIKKKRKISIQLIVIIIAVCVFVGVAAVSSLLFCLSKKKKKYPILGSSSRESFLKVSYGGLLKATGGFSSTNLIGVGSFGSVYKGLLDWDGTVVAIKVLNLQRQGASKSFMAECNALRSIRHRNLVKIITSCSGVDFQGNDFKALVYEFMPNGSLERWLHPVLEADLDQDEIKSINLLQRLNIAIDVACALDYLHHHCQKPIVHCDLKPSNILLDSDMIGHVSDFGLAKFLLELIDPNQSNSVGIRGTIGYTAPEYGLGSEVSTSGDVYSYGILLLEMMIGKRPTDRLFKEGLNLHNFARTALPDRVMEIVDPILLNDNVEVAMNNTTLECLISIIKIGVTCSMESPQDRMNITTVVQELHLIREIIQDTGMEYSQHELRGMKFKTSSKAELHSEKAELDSEMSRWTS